jgi:hypothetical protein
MANLGMADAGAALRAAAAAVADLIVPPLCLSCHSLLSSHDTICSACWGKIDFIRPPLCDRLGIPLPFDAGGTMISAAAVAAPPHYHRARAVARFDGIMRDLVHDLKFHDRHDARRLFGRWLAEAGAELLADADVIVPVPLTRLRLSGAASTGGHSARSRETGEDRSVGPRAHAPPPPRSAEPRAATAERGRRFAVAADGKRVSPGPRSSSSMT